MLSGQKNDPLLSDLYYVLVRWGGRGGETNVYCSGSGFPPVSSPELRQDVPDITLDGTQTKFEVDGYLRILTSSNDLAQNLGFAARQRLRDKLLDLPSRDVLSYAN